MSTYLPDTALASVSIGKKVYAYAQTYEGVLIECQGQLKTVKGTADIYSYQLQSHVTARYEDDEVVPGAPKLFTPLAAAYIGNIRYLFYVDDNNIIRDVKSTSTPWEDGGLSRLSIRCAHYSNLAAITISNNTYQAICLYYQTPERNAAITMASFSTKNNTWVYGVPDMKPIPPPPTPPPRVVDPPLYGTSLSAVPTRKGIEVIPGSTLPVVHLQWDSLALAHSQDMKVETIQSLDLRFAPHTSLATLDDGTNLYCFYTSSQNNNIKKIIINNGKATEPETVATPTPRSAISAVLPIKERIVLFYQSLNADAGTVELYGMSFSRPAGSSTTTWTTHQRTKLG